MFFQEKNFQGVQAFDWSVEHYLSIRMMQFEVMVESRDEGTGGFAKVDRLKDLFKISDHRIGADTLEEFRKCLCDEFTLNLVLEIR